MTPRSDFVSHPQAASPTPSPNPLSVFTPFWARPDHGETLPAPVTITYVDHYPAPSDDDSDYWVDEDEDDDSFVEDREHPQAASPTPSPNPLSVFTPFWARPDHGETLPAPVTITYVDHYPAPSDDDSDYWVYEDEDDDSFVEDREHPQAASPTPSPNPLSVFTPFWARPDHGETLPAPVTITYVDHYPAPSDDDSDYWVYEDEDDDSFVEDREHPQAASPTPSPNPLSVFTPFWARPDHGETLPAPVTITYVDHYPAPSDDDSDYWVYEDEDDDSFVEDREHPQAASPTPSPNPLSVFTPFWARPDHGETLPAPVTITYVDHYPAPSDDDSDYWVYEDEDDDSFVEDREVHPLRKALRRHPQAASPTPSPNPLSVFTPFWARPDHGETLPAPVTITYVDHYPAPSDDDSDYWVYEDEDDDSFVEDREHPQAASPTPSPNPLSVFTPFWARPDHGETLPAPVTITYVDHYPAPSDDDSDYWVYEDEDDDSFVEDREHPQAASPTPSPNPLSVFIPFWARPDHGETLPAPVTITYVDHYPAPSDDDSDYWVYEDEDDDSFVEDREHPQAASPTPSPNPLSVFTPFWARPDHGETLPAPVTITYVDHYPAPSDDDSDYWVYEDEDDDSFVEDRELQNRKEPAESQSVPCREITIKLLV
ncbi:uncharacterized protein [Haliotis cracherodii]|uniref:uncharacterized protein n=1 Tax=Haliotis cracherodii TaxID=6455 RepID=UPI0039EC5468